jgi:hypothetical protein
MQFLFALAIFVSALLLFVVEPMVGKMLLPLLGGTPGVWNTCLVFFQAVLLAGYLYSHLSTAWLGVRRQAVLHVVILALPFLALPIVVPADLVPADSSSDQPALWVLRVLVMTVGLPFFVVSTSGSLLQRWFAGTGHRGARDPYFLYAASNFGSLLALLAYPFLIEPLLPLARQSWEWSVGYGGFVLLAVACALALWRSPAEEAPAKETADAPPASAERLTAGRRTRWVLLAFVPSSLLMGVTTHLSTDIAAIPLLWVVPLALYLLSFILVFASKPPLRHTLMTRLLPPAVVLLTVFLASGASDPIWLVIPLHLVTFFIAAMVCHGELARDRPSAAHLTEFYLWLSVGGVLGGLFNALFAPVAFRFVGLVEYPLALVLACVLRPAPRPVKRDRADALLPAGVGVVTVGLLFLVQALGLPAGPVRTLLSFGVPALAVYTFAERPLRFALGIGALMVVGGLPLLPNPRGKELYFERNFFGFVRVFERAEGEPNNLFHEFVHGTTIHGRQSQDPGRRLEPTAYYFRTGPMGDIFAQFDATAERRRAAGSTNDVCIAGLGAGGLCCYRLDPQHQPRHAGQKWVFYEIDPAVERVARDPNYFTFLRDCFPDGPQFCQVDLGDARLRMRDAPDHGFGLIILDAFSSDSVPVHLLSQEALRLYRTKLAKHGILVFNISNRYLNLKPVLAGLAADAGLVYRNRDDLAPIPPEEKRLGKTNSQWVVMAEGEDDIPDLAKSPRWVPNTGPTTLWTDDFSNLLGLVMWAEFVRLQPATAAPQ